MKMTKIEYSILNFINKRLDIIFLLIMTILAILIRLFLLPFESNDYTEFLSNWLEKISNYGALSSLGHSIGDYNVPYMIILALISKLPFSNLILIKIVSILFDFLLAFISSLIVKEITKNKTLQLVTYLVILFIPTVIINGSYWGQCDSIYSTFALTAIYFLLKNKNILSFIILGIAFSFKLQTIFILPVFIIVYLVRKNFSVLNFLIIPLVNFIMCLPAIIMGRGLIETMTIYLNQTETYQKLTLGVPNLYRFISGPFELIYMFAIIITVAAFGFLVYFVLKNKAKIDSEMIITLSLISILMCNFLLPCMHERYMFMADIISVIWFVCYRKKLFVPIGISIISIMSYMNFLYSSVNGYVWQILGILYGFILIELFIYLKNSLRRGES